MLKRQYNYKKELFSTKTKKEDETHITHTLDIPDAAVIITQFTLILHKQVHKIRFLEHLEQLWLLHRNCALTCLSLFLLAESSSVTGGMAP